MLEAAIEQRIELAVPSVALEELERVLRRKLGYTRGRARDARAVVRELAAVIAVPRRIEAVSGDPGDDAVLASAAAWKADVLVTGDRKHLLPLGEYRGVRIRTPQALLAELRA